MDTDDYKFDSDGEIFGDPTDSYLGDDTDDDDDDLDGAGRGQRGGTPHFGMSIKEGDPDSDEYADPYSSGLAEEDDYSDFSENFKRDDV